MKKRLRALKTPLMILIFGLAFCFIGSGYWVDRVEVLHSLSIRQEITIELLGYEIPEGSGAQTTDTGTDAEPEIDADTETQNAIDGGDEIESEPELDGQA